MRPCYHCERFSPRTADTPFVGWPGEPIPESWIGGCHGKGRQFDPEITEPDLGMYCDLFKPKAKPKAKTQDTEGGAE